MGEAEGGVEAGREGDGEERFRRLYEAHYRAVSAYAHRRSPGAADASDAVAETFTIAWRRIGEMPDADVALPWLYGVARRVLANQRRGDRRRADLSTRLQGAPPGSVEIESRIFADDDRRTVLAALSRLREPDREILRLAVWEELSHREIAQVVGCSDASVAVRLHRARNRLGAEIAKEERRAGQQRSAGPGRGAEGQER